MSNVNFAGVQVQQLMYMWPHAREFVLSALEHGRGEFDEAAIYHEISDGGMQLWLLWREGDANDELLGAAVTQILEFPTRAVVEIVLAGGRDFHLWGDQIAVIEAWGLERGAQELRFFGRPGFEKAMVPLGYRKSYVVYSKTLGVIH